MGRKPRSLRNKRTTSRAPAETSGANVFMAPTSGLNNAMFTQGTKKDTAKYMDMINKLARYVGTQAWSQSTVDAKAVIELVEPESVDPTKPTRMYYLAVPLDMTAPNPRKKKEDRFEVGTLKENITVADNIEWKMTFSEYAVKRAK